jgi:hypothetical protein
LKELIAWARDKCLTESIQDYLYYYFFSKDSIDKKLMSIKGEIDEIAIKGYKSISIPSEEINRVISRSPVKGINYSSNIYTLIGLYLCAPQALEKDLVRKYEQSSIKHKYIISKLLPSLKENLQRYINSLEKSDPDFDYVPIINCLIDSKFQQNNPLVVFSKVNEHNIDMIDLIMMEEYERLLLADSSKQLINNLTINETILQVLNNFDNASRNLRDARRAGKENYKINDEYDVQDLLYVMLKPIFPNLETEDPVPKIGGRGSRIDLVLKEYGILIETKMIKNSDQNENKYIKELKEDFESYHSFPGIKNLIVFVYDPFRKTRDRNNFISLSGLRKKNEIEYHVEVIVT